MMTASWSTLPGSADLARDAYDHWHNNSGAGGTRSNGPLVLAEFSLLEPVPELQALLKGLHETDGVFSAFSLPGDGATISVLGRRGAFSAAQKGLVLRGESLPVQQPPAAVEQNTPPEASGWENVTDPLVITAIIDTGIAFAHEAFRIAGFGSRILAFMDQRIPVRTTAPGSRETGLVLRKQDIDTLIADHTRPDGGVDEMAIYRKAGTVDFAGRDVNSLARRAGHGTQVLNSAIGRTSEVEVRHGPAKATDSEALRNPIIAVQLPDGFVRDSSGHNGIHYIRAAVEFIRSEAARLQRDHPAGIPIVLNYSFGNHADRHDGYGDLELYFDHLLRHGDAPLPDEPWFHSVVLPAGNALQARGHAVFSGSELKAGTQVLDWVVQPDDRTSSFVQIWVPAGIGVIGGPSPLRIEVLAPGAPPSPVTPGQTTPYAHELTDRGEVIARVYHQVHQPDLAYAPAGAGLTPGVIARHKITIAIKPTSGEGMACAPFGRWQIALSDPQGVLADTDEVDLWIERSNAPGGFRAGGRQSYFDHPAYVRFDPIGKPALGDSPDCPVRRSGTLSGIANGAFTAVVSGLREGVPGTDPVGYGSRGPSRPAPGKTIRHRDGPDVAASADWTWARPGLISIGNASGATSVCRGTSFAAPMVAWDMVLDALDIAGPVTAGGKRPALGTTSPKRGARFENTPAGIGPDVAMRALKPHRRNRQG